MTAGDKPRTGPSAGERRLEAPHRRGGDSPRVVERLAVAGFRATSWLLASLPPKPAAAVIGRASQLSYLAWPTKRRWSNRNFANVLGLHPDHPKVRQEALRAYRGYGRYLVELMRLPSLPPAEVAEMVPDIDADEIKRLWRAAPGGGGLIFTVGHVGNNEAVAAAIARHDMPISVVADDSSFPEIFEILRRQRESWGVRIIAWRNLREIFGVLRRKEMLALLVDWGYRSDGIPVRLFGSWTTLPAGPATLAAKTGSRILPITIRRRPDDTFLVTFPEPIDLASSDPAELQRATQAMADALASTIAAAPDQWYSFKPLWPATEDEAADLERRATMMQAGQPDPGPAPEFA
ncbi:MAG TPA: lysophospholipid acyltransferase family protein [Candidatus Limnocylindrales bacterium]|nr:lysophospholipid acyltransferase family protein [Candidatus Limnocylindrales bacterium]